MVFTRNRSSNTACKDTRFCVRSGKHQKEVYVITANQIEYAKLLETRRANQEQEAMTKLRDATTRKLGFAQLAETARSNLAKEDLNRASLDETTRANMAKESQNVLSLAEQSRANMARENETHRANVASEQQKQAELAEQVRMHGVQEAETATHNRASEAAAFDAAQARRDAASINLAGTQMRTALGYRELEEQTRASLARESESQRANLAREAEERRSNLAREGEAHRSAIAQEEMRTRELNQKALSVAFDGAKTVSGVVKDFASAASSVAKIIGGVAMGG